MKLYCLGVDLGATNLRAGIVNTNGEIEKKLKGLTQAAKGPERVLKNIISALQKLLAFAEENGFKIEAIGIGSPGHVDFETGIVISATPNLPGWTGMPLKEKIEEKFSLPAFVDNDGNVAALGEKIFGAGKEVNNLVAMTIGTGIGGGVIINGELHRGAGFGAGEVGHITINLEGKECNCGNYGCIESYGAMHSIIGRARKAIAQGLETKIKDLIKGNLDLITPEVVFRASQLGDEVAISIIRETGRYIGAGVVNIINIIAPEMVLIGGGIAQFSELLFKTIREEVALRMPRELVGFVKIEPAKLGEDSGLIGAAALAFKGMKLI